MREAGENGSRYRLIMCHRRRPEVGAREMAAHWREERSGLVSGLREALGFSRYAQVHAAPRYHPIYRILLWSRSRLGEVMFFPGRLPMRLREALGTGATRQPDDTDRWDVVDQLWFPSAQALERAFTTPEGRDAADRLRRDHAGMAERTRVVVGEERVAATDEGPGRAETKILYLLRCLPEMSAEEMQAYWGSDHRSLVLSARDHMGYRGFEQIHTGRPDVLARAAEALGAEAGDDVQGVASLSFAGPSAMVGSLVLPNRVLTNRRVLADELRFLDGPRCCMIFGRELTF